MIKNQTLNKKFIDSLKAKDKDYIVWDNIVTGFGCKVTIKGRKVFIYTYRNLDQKKVRLTLGKYGLLTVEMARKKLKGILDQINAGIDPQQEKQQSTIREKESILFKDFWDIFDTKYIQYHHKAGTISRNAGRIKNYIMPFFGDKKLNQIEYKDVVKFMEQPTFQKAPINGARCLALISPAFKQAELWGYRAKGTNPCVGVPKKATGKKERFLTDAEKQTLEDILKDPTLHKNRSPYVMKAILLLLYTGCRRSEITTLQWQDVHLKDKFIYFKDSKTGTKTVPLNTQAIKLLESIKRQPNNPYVFPGKIPGTCLQEIRKAWESVRNLAGIPDVRLHDLRHSFASFALKKGVDLYTVSKLLGHKNITTTTRYAHLELDALKKASNKVFG